MAAEISMGAFTLTNLWNSSLEGRKRDKFQSARERLRSVYLRCREHAALIAGEIPQDLREFTVHDITHLDALWEMADLICGAESQVNPVEAFVLGASFLLHDLGLSLAAFPGGRESVMRNPVWQDHMVGRLQNRLHHPPTPGEINSAPEVDKKAATETTLRILHAEQAEKLAQICFTHRNKTYHLVEDQEVRESLGPLIGRIAHSHWWPVSRLAEEFGTIIGAPHWCPGEWTIDPLKLACILRLADAIHLDARRAPGFLRALRKPGEASDLHWAFQQNLQKPQTDSDRIIFTSSRPFPLGDAPAWWLCYQTLQMVDLELKQVDALLADMGRGRFALRAVAGCEDPNRLARYIRTENWIPVEARIRISNVPDIVRKLGGEELYGDRPYVCLRELVQNAADAIEARRVLEGREPNWGSITVRLYKNGDRHILEVADAGIGMSEQVLTGPFLDFGTSYWGSPLMSSEFPGLLAKGFQSTGRFGIGFFSVFMVANKVSVLTRRFDKGASETRVLEFGRALTAPPILRPAQEHENLRDGGTCVRLELSVPPDAPDGLLRYQHYTETIDLSSLLGWLCPTLNADLYAECNGKKHRVLSANDWSSISSEELVARTVLPDSEMSGFRQGLRKIAKRLLPITDENGRPLGRVAVLAGERWTGAVYDWGYEGVVSVGGLRASALMGIAGVLVGYPLGASRDRAKPVVDLKQISAWATTEANIVARENLDPITQMETASLLVACGGNVSPLAVAYTADGWLTPVTLRHFLRDKQRVRIVNHPYELLRITSELSLDPDVILLRRRIREIVYSAEPARAQLLSLFEEWPDITRRLSDGLKNPLPWTYELGSLGACLMEAVCDAWDTDLATVAAGLKIADIRGKRERVGLYRGKPCEEYVDTLLKGNESA
jgi:hypothetical protein